MKRHHRLAMIVGLISAAGWLVGCARSAPPAEPGHAQPPTSNLDNDPRRFWAVKSWNGTFTVHRQGTGDLSADPSERAHYHGSIHLSASGAFHLADRREDDRFQLQPVHWSGDGHGQVSINFHDVSGNRSYWNERSTRGSGATALRKATLPKFPPDAGTTWEDKPLGPELAIRPGGRYDLTLGIMELDVREQDKLLGFAYDKLDHTKENGVSRPAYLIVELGHLPLPEHGLVLKGSKTVTYGVGGDTCHLIRDVRLPGGDVVGGSFVVGHDFPAPNDTPECVVTWELTPAADEVRLVIESEDQGLYDTWTPHAGKDEKTPGNDIPFIARLETPDGTPATTKARKIRFELVDVSREPGIAINYPLRTEATDDFDLRFHQDRNAGHLNVVGDDGQIAETPSGGAGVTQARVVVTAHDYGAYGFLRAVAEMPDGTQAIGKLEGQPNRRALLLPKRKDSSRIAESLRNKLDDPNLSDDDDGESKPVGDGFVGDGLTLYEEYRGFFVNGVHTRGDPAKKDLFVWDKVRNQHADPGIRHFEEVAGGTERALVIHRITNDDEVMIDQVVNCNCSPRTPRRTSQHAIKIGEGGVGAPNAKSHTVEAIPGSPKGVRLIVLAPGFRPGTEDFKLMTAHELGHALNIPHHGQGDLGWTVWKTAKNQAGKTILTESPFAQDETAEPNGNPRTTTAKKSRNITVKNEDGTPFVPDETFDDGVKIWVANWQGQHSGDESCLMRYYAAKAYVKPGNNTVRYWIKPPEVHGAGLCTANDATGAAARRYGDATAGDCLHRFRISDAP